jgi:excisionase family DNA binding protein
MPGQAMVEYAVIIAAIAVVAWGAYNIMGHDIGSMASGIDSSLTSTWRASLSLQKTSRHCSGETIRWRRGESGDPLNGRVTGMMRRKFLTVDELSEYLHVHKTTIYRMLKQGTLPGFRVGTDWRFDVDVVEQWVRDQKNKPH